MTFFPSKIWQHLHTFSKRTLFTLYELFWSTPCVAKIRQQKAKSIVCDIVRNCAQQKMNFLNAVKST
jgi:hypothetical protein